ncbi:DnaJ domain-containing protein [Nitrospira defluvii]|nr:DnaJ domain-containing protein [Nitrospira defluvii]
MTVTPEKIGPVRGSFFDKKQIKRPCWSCQSDVDDLYNCASCTAIQAFVKEIDYFTLFGLGYLLSVDLTSLETQYYSLSRKFHPDFYQNKTAEEQAISLENTALLTKAYRTLKDPKSRATYLVNFIEGEKTLPTEAPAGLLEDILEIQERLEDSQDLERNTPQTKGLIENLKLDLKKMEAYRNEEQQQLETFSFDWDTLEENRKDRSFGEDQKNCLNKMKKVLSHDAYLNRIIQDIQSALKKE